MTRCIRCKHPLTDPVSIKRGMGPDCWALTIGEMLAGSTNDYDIIDLPFDPETRDIICQRDARGQAHFNIPQRVIKHSPTGMEFGYSGSGCADLALNILCLFTRLHVAEYAYQEFKATFVATLPREGGVIRGADVRTWLRDRYSDGEYRASLLVPEFETAGVS